MLVRAALKDRAHEIGLPDSLRALIEHSDETLARQINYILEQLESPPPDEKEVRDVMSFACVGWADPMPRDLIGKLSRTPQGEPICFGFNLGSCSKVFHQVQRPIAADGDC